MSLELELEVKVMKPPTDEEDDIQANAKKVLGNKSLLDGSLDINDPEKFEYRRLAIKLNQLEGRGDFDGIHTVIYLPYGTFLARIPYDHFNIIHEAMTGIATKRVSDYHITKGHK